MFMLHKTFGVPKGGGGPAVGAYGCTRGARAVPARARWSSATASRYRLDDGGPLSVGKVRECRGNVQQVVKAYAWTLAMGADGIREAADLSVLANNYMEGRLLAIRGVTRSHPEATTHRLEMTRYSLGQLHRGDRRHSRRRAEPDGGLRHRRVVAQPRAVDRARAVHAGGRASCGRRRTSTTGSTCSRTFCEEAYEDPEIVTSAPHNQVDAQARRPSSLDDPDRWATTWRAYRRKTSLSGVR